MTGLGWICDQASFQGYATYHFTSRLYKKITMAIVVFVNPAKARHPSDQGSPASEKVSNFETEPRDGKVQHLIGSLGL